MTQTQKQQENLKVLDKKQIDVYLKDYFKNRFKDYFKKIKKDYPTYFKNVSFKTFIIQLIELFNYDSDLINNNHSIPLISEDFILDDLTIPEIYRINDFIEDYSTKELQSILIDFEEQINKIVYKKLEFFNFEDYLYFFIEVLNCNEKDLNLEYNNYSQKSYLNFNSHSLNYEDINYYDNLQDFIIDELENFLEGLSDYQILALLFNEYSNYYNNILDTYIYYKDFNKYYNEAKQDLIKSIKEKFKDDIKQNQKEIRQNKKQIILLNDKLNKFKKDKLINELITKEINTLQKENITLKENTKELKNTIKQNEN